MLVGIDRWRNKSSLQGNKFSWKDHRWKPNVNHGLAFLRQLGPIHRTVSQSQSHPSLLQVSRRWPEYHFNFSELNFRSADWDMYWLVENWNMFWRVLNCLIASYLCETVPRWKSLHSSWHLSAHYHGGGFQSGQLIEQIFIVLFRQKNGNYLSANLNNLIVILMFTGSTFNF